jgi:hypothetical protein
MQLAGLYKSVYMKHCIKKGTPFHSIHSVFYFHWDITNQNGQFRRFIHHSHPFPMLFSHPEDVLVQEKLTAISADYQSAGRGTQDRSWHAAKALTQKLGGYREQSILMGKLP